MKLGLKLFRWKHQETPQASTTQVVIVDDEQDLCTLLRIALEAEGYSVATAHDGEAGLALIQERRPLLAILDIMMPRMNGYQVLARLQQDPEFAAMPVYIMTSLSDEAGTSNEEWARRLGVEHFLSKPLDIDDLVRRVKDRLEAPHHAPEPIAQTPEPVTEAPEPVAEASEPEKEADAADAGCADSTTPDSADTAPAAEEPAPGEPEPEAPTAAPNPAPKPADPAEGSIFDFGPRN